MRPAMSVAFAKIPLEVLEYDSIQAAATIVGSTVILYEHTEWTSYWSTSIENTMATLLSLKLKCV